MDYRSKYSYYIFRFADCQALILFIYFCLFYDSFASFVFFTDLDLLWLMSCEIMSCGLLFEALLLYFLFCRLSIALFFVLFFFSLYFISHLFFLFFFFADLDWLYTTFSLIIDFSDHWTICKVSRFSQKYNVHFTLQCVLCMDQVCTLFLSRKCFSPGNVFWTKKNSTYSKNKRKLNRFCQ